MSPLLIGAIIALILTVLVIISNEVFGLLSSDHFPTTLHRWAAYLWFGLLILFIGVNVAGSAQTAGEFDPSQIQFWALFSMHVILLLFLFGWWSLAGRKPILDFLNLRTDEFAKDTAIGFVVGFGGWFATMVAAISVGMVVQLLDMLPENLEPAPMVDYMVNLAWWQKTLIILSAMSVEEFFFRGWMQKRFGLIVSTVIFAIAHAGYGQPLFLVGVTAISLVIGATFYYTRRLWPCIIAHGVFDAIQLFIVVPTLTKFSGAVPETVAAVGAGI